MERPGIGDGKAVWVCDRWEAGRQGSREAGRWPASLEHQVFLGS